MLKIAGIVTPPSAAYSYSREDVTAGRWQRLRFQTLGQVFTTR